VLYSVKHSDKSQQSGELCWQNTILVVGLLKVMRFTTIKLFFPYRLAYTNTGRHNIKHVMNAAVLETVKQNFSQSFHRMTVHIMSLPVLRSALCWETTAVVDVIKLDVKVKHSTSM